MDNLETLLSRQGLHSPNHCPQDGLPYRTIHDTNVQAARHVCSIPCGPGGVAHRFCPWEVLRGIAVVDDDTKGRVEEILDGFPQELRKKVAVRKGWYY